MDLTNNGLAVIIGGVGLVLAALVILFGRRGGKTLFEDAFERHARALDRIVTAQTTLDAEFAKATRKLRAISTFAATIAASNNSVYKKVARELREILDANTQEGRNAGDHQ